MQTFITSDKPKRFFFHYRRTTKGMTVHFNKQCLPCKNIICKVATETKYNKIQPYLVIQGFCRNIVINNETQTIEIF